MIPNTNLRLAFFGSSSYCLPLIKALSDNFQLVTVITRPDSTGGKKKTQMSTPVKQFAMDNNITVTTPINKEELRLVEKDLKRKDIDLSVVADYGLIIPKNLLQLPRYGSINIHFSKLPDLRGASPVQYTLLFGDKNAWISIIAMSEKVDTGDIIWQKKIPLKANETAEDLYNRLFRLTTEKISEIIVFYTQDKLKIQKQNDEKATYTRLLKKDDGFVPFNLLLPALKGKTHIQLKSYDIQDDSLLYQALKKSNNPATIIERALRAFTPWPGVWTEISIKYKVSSMKYKKRLKLVKTHLDDDKLIVDEVQLEGKRPVSWKQFLEGYPEIENQIR